MCTMKDDIGYDYTLIKYDDPYKIMQMDLSIPIPDRLPSLLLEEVNKMKTYYNECLYLHFEHEIEGVEGLIKNYHAVGEISDADAKTLFKIFGWKW